MFRLYFSIFWGKEAAVHGSHGEGTATMRLPLVILTAGTLLAGFVPFSNYVSSDSIPFATSVDWIFSIAPVALAALAILLAANLYKKENDKPQKIASLLGGLYQSAYRKFYIDEIYVFITKKIIFNGIGRPAAWIDKNMVDGLMNGMASVTAKAAAFIKGIQSGKIQSYTLYFFGGIACLAVMVIYLWK